jgi:mRNA-degrading endonuclease toxin of MazEF toxin-antitoxin module
MPPSEGYRFGDVVWVDVPYTDSTGEKRRPVVIVSSDRYHRELPDFLIMPITGSTWIDSRFGSVEILDAVPAGLSKPSVIKPVIQTVDRKRIRSKCGALDKTTRANLQRMIRELFG